MDNAERFFEPGGAIAGHMEFYEARPQQIRMAQAVEETISSSGTLLVEAGTGVGKSLAYLVPFISWAVAGEKRVVISTYTKALQTQLYVKELPFLERALGLPFRYALCMGSDNYVCLRKSRRRSRTDAARSKTAARQAAKLLDWISGTETGLRTDLDFEPDADVWSLFSRESDVCLGRKCPRAGECFYLKARQAQLKAHILIANHSLLFTDMMSEAKLLPAFDALVLDEAHTLEDVATSHFGRAITSAAALYIVEGITAALAAEKRSPAHSEDIKEFTDDVKKRAKDFHAAADVFFTKAGEFFGLEERIADLAGSGFIAEDISAETAALSQALNELARRIDDAEERELFHSLGTKCDMFAEALDVILYQEKDPDHVYWLEVRPSRKNATYAFHSAPVDISARLREDLFDVIRPVVLTSATLASASVNGKADFGYIKKRLGLSGAAELALDSPFDYGKNVLVFTPGGIPDPNVSSEGYKKGLKDRIIEMYDILGGRMFALFTSYEMLNAVSAMISEARPEISLLKQGDLPRYVLLDVFKKSRESVLMGTATFWQGVDVPGSSLECVMITRFPFATPGDPINAARIKAIERKGASAFAEYQLPQAIIMFKQGFGRLIRTASDRGVVAILDPRVRTKGYGRRFIEALPKCARTDKIADVKAFFKQDDGELRVEYDEDIQE